MMNPFEKAREIAKTYLYRKSSIDLLSMDIVNYGEEQVRNFRRAVFDRTKKQTFAVGTVVRLKSGGPKMVIGIRPLAYFGSNDELVLVHYYDESVNEIKQVQLPEKALIEVGDE